MVTDAHTHLFPHDPTPSDLRLTLEQALAVFEEAGITRVLAGCGTGPQGLGPAEYREWNKRIADGCAGHANLIPAGIIHTSLQGEACEVLRYCHGEIGMRFVGELFDRWGGFTWPDPHYDRLLELAVELRMIPLLHCENEVAATIGDRYPEGRFIIAHLETTSEGLYPRLEMLAGRENLFLDVSGSAMGHHGWIKKAVETLGAERVLFGSDLPAALDPVIAVECVKHSHLPEESQAQVFDGTFQRLLEWTAG